MHAEAADQSAEGPADAQTLLVQRRLGAAPWVAAAAAVRVVVVQVAWAGLQQVEVVVVVQLWQQAVLVLHQGGQQALRGVVPKLPKAAALCRTSRAARPPPALGRVFAVLAAALPAALPVDACTAAAAAATPAGGAGWCAAHDCSCCCPCCCLSLWSLKHCYGDSDQSAAAGGCWCGACSYAALRLVSLVSQMRVAAAAQHRRRLPPAM